MDMEGLGEDVQNLVRHTEDDTYEVHRRTAEVLHDAF